jgi:hypothetical protein
MNKKGAEMNKTIDEVIELLAGKYNPISFSVYCLLASGINNSEHGEYRFTRSEIISRLTFKRGNRPIKLNSEALRVVLEKFWEDGLFEFRSSTKGCIARYPTGDALWIGLV